MLCVNINSYFENQFPISNTIDTKSFSMDSKMRDIIPSTLLKGKFIFKKIEG